MHNWPGNVREMENLLTQATVRARNGIITPDLLVNTSFNVRGEPIVCTPGDAYRCFMRTEMDIAEKRIEAMLLNETTKIQSSDPAH